MTLSFANFTKHPKTSIIGALTTIGIVAGVFATQGITLGHAGTGTVVGLIAALVPALIGGLMKDPGSGSTPPPAAMIAFVLVLAFAATARAQTTLPSAPAPATTGLQFATSVQALELDIAGTTASAESTLATLNFTTTTQLQGQVIVGPGFKGYYGGYQWTPNIAKLIAKTLLPSDTLQPYVSGFGGVAQQSDGINHASEIVGGGLNYDPTGAGHFSVQAGRFDWVHIGSKNGWAVGGGISVIFPQN